jgi:hypothetical protein
MVSAIKSARAEDSGPSAHWPRPFRQNTEDPMDVKIRPAPRLAPLPADANPEVKDALEASRKRMGFVPNSQLIMQRKPKILKAFAALSAAVNDPEGQVPNNFKRLIGQKLDAVWDYQTSPLFTPAERAALDVAVAAGSVPNAVTDEMFLELKKHWTEEQIVEIVAVIAIFGFLNRWNDTLATPLEDDPTHFAEDHLAKHGWTIGKHAR